MGARNDGEHDVIERSESSNRQ